MPIISIMSALILPLQAPQPVRLETVAAGDAVEVRVLGRSEVPTAARYRLEVRSGSGNRSTQSGTARLLPGQEPVLIRLRMSSGSVNEWSVRLFVEPEGGAAYEQAASSPAPR